jgi:pimeloyl-ACP methyl ester carboxylesterase
VTAPADVDVRMWDETVPVEDGWIAMSVVLPDDPQGTVVFCHGLGGDRRGPADLFAGLATATVTVGRAAVRFDFRGSGEASGELIDTSIGSMLDDVRAVVDRVQTLVPAGRTTLVGHSIGGVVTALAATDPSGVVDEVICIAADLTPFDYGADKPVLFARDTDYFPVGFAAWRATLDLTRADFRVPFTFVTGTAERPGILTTARLLGARGVPVRQIEGADHLFTRHRDQLGAVMKSVLASGVPR